MEAEAARFAIRKESEIIGDVVSQIDLDQPDDIISEIPSVDNYFEKSGSGLGFKKKSLYTKAAS